MKPNQHTFMPTVEQEDLLGRMFVACEVCCQPQEHENHQVPEDPKRLLGELFEVMQREILADRVWMTPERDALMLRCAKVLGKTLR